MIPSVQVIAVPDMTALHEATAMVKASAASVAVVQKEADVALLRERLAQALSRAVVRDVPLSLDPVTAEPEAGLAWLPRAVKMLDAASAVTAMFVCVEVPTGLKGAALREADAAVAALRGLPAFEAGRVKLAQGPLWRAVASLEPCDRPSEAPPPADALPDAGAPKVDRPAR